MPIGLSQLNLFVKGRTWRRKGAASFQTGLGLTRRNELPILIPLEDPATASLTHLVENGRCDRSNILDKGAQISAFPPFVILSFILSLIVEKTNKKAKLCCW
jgi:hypothetical protein